VNKLTNRGFTFFQYQSYRPLLFYSTPFGLYFAQDVYIKKGGIMTTDKASFFARDPSPFASDGEATGQKKYMGTEQRRFNRRALEERRGEIRFELSKEVRRNSTGRRENDSDPKFW
jgi:hypothetical protein